MAGQGWATLVSSGLNSCIFGCEKGVCGVMESWGGVGDPMNV